MRRLAATATALAALAGLAVPAPAAAQAPPLLRSIEGPVPMRALASGFGSTIFAWRYRSDGAPITGDGDRWVAWRLPSKPGATLLDTQTMAVRDVPSCELANGHAGTFAATCGGRAALYDAASGEIRPIPGAQEFDRFLRIGSQWLAGNDFARCDGPRCEVRYVWVNRHTGERRAETPCEECTRSDAGDRYDLDAPDLRRRRYDPLTVQDDLSITRRFRHPLVVRQRGRRPVRLSDCRGPQRFDRCDDNLAGRRVSWATTSLRPATPRGAVHSYDVDTAARARWTVRFRPHRLFGCRQQYGAPLRSFHTRYAVLALTVYRFAPSPRGAKRCMAYPASYTLHAAPLTGAAR